MKRSMFNPSGEETAREGGRYGAREAKKFSKMPPHLVDGEVQTDADIDTKVDCDTDPQEDVCKIAEANKRRGTRKPRSKSRRKK